MKRVLVIGGNGFIGGNIVDYFLNRNCEIGVYDLKKGLKAGVTYFSGDIINDDRLEQIVAGYETIVYLISAIMPQKSMDEPLSSYLTDVPLMIRTLETAKESGVRRIVYASSGGTIYGDSEVANIEDKPLNPINHYAICKLTCEKILFLYNDLFGMENVVLRIANPYGRGQRLESGVGAITTFTRHILADEKIDLYGDGRNVRDYIDVEEVARAFYLAVEWKFEKNITPVFNVGSGKGLSLNDIIKLISEYLKVSPKISFLPQRKFDVRCNYLDMNKSKQYLGFCPNGIPEEGIKKYVQSLKTEYINK